jgi:molecular chaperone DnaK (HSP70)
MIQQLVRDFFGKEPHKGVNPDEVWWQLGAAIQGAVLGGEVKDCSFLMLPPDSWNRDSGRCFYQDDSKKHHHSNQKE